jgi:hypothetical protein
LEGVAGEEGDGFAVDLVAGGDAAAQIVVIHAGEVVVDEGVGVEALDGGGGEEGGGAGAPQASAAGGAEEGRRRLPPAKRLWRMAAWSEAGRVRAGRTRRSRAVSIQRAPSAR